MNAREKKSRSTRKRRKERMRKLRSSQPSMLALPAPEKKDFKRRGGRKNRHGRVRVVAPPTSSSSPTTSTSTSIAMKPG
eukprot:9950494-Karenia_brevis.AAC.1